MEKMNQAQYLKEIIALFDQPAVIVDGRGKIVAANDIWSSFCGFGSTRKSCHSIVEVCPDLVFPLKQRELTVNFQILSGEQRSCTVLVTVLGRDHFFLRVYPQQTQTENSDGFHSQRLRTLGMLAGGIAHDFNNILTGILGHISYLNAVLPKTGNHTESLGAIEDGARKASLITQQILNFSKLDVNESLVKVDLVDLTRRMFTLLRGAISPRFNLSLRLPDDSIIVRGIEGKLAQVIVNLVINARDAIEPDGEIVVSVSLVSTDTKAVAQSKINFSAAQECVRLAVSDNGKGMSAEVATRACEPYFTTKGQLGTGLGLATVKAIVDDLSGFMLLQSEPRQGTTVEVFLPLYQDEKSLCQEDSGNGRLSLAGGCESILIVDDERAVRNVLSLSLEHLGYQVEMADCGHSALEIFAEAPEKYDLVILDMLMPQLSGDQVFFRLKELKSDVKVLLISGYSSEEAVQSVLDNGGLDFIQKPFTIDQLSKKVRDCLDV